MTRGRQPKLPGSRVSYQEFKQWLQQAGFRVDGAAKVWLEMGAGESWNAGIALAAYLITSQAEGEDTVNVREVLMELGRIRIDLDTKKEK